jgi:hypothetical protein
MEKEHHNEETVDKLIWKKSYTLLLLINVIYIVLFYFFMKTYA